eukprot:contig_21355_g5252
MPPDDISFTALRSTGMWFYDFTRYLPKLASTSSRQTMMCRPGRTGKTLILSAFAFYLDELTSREEFFSYFEGTDACPHSTQDPLPHGACSYKVLSLDFTAESTEDAAAMSDELKQGIIVALEDFVDRYNVDIEADVLRRARLGEASFSSTLERVVRAASKDGGRVYILVDEYDRVCNKLMMENPKAYKSMVSEDVARAASLPISNIYDQFKKLAFKYPELRTFSIGITPVAMADATGANTVADLSRSRTFADMLGFRRDAVVSAIRRVPGLKQKQQSLVLRRLQRFYNGYRHLGSDGTLFHPKMCVNCLARMVEDQQYRMKVSDPDTSAMDQLELLKAIDVDTSHSAMSMVLSQQHLTAALEQDKWVTSGTLEDSMRKRRQVEVRLAPFMQKLRFAALLSQDDSAVLSVLALSSSASVSSSTSKGF